MSEAEWNEIALRNAENFKKEADKRKAKLHEQREVMRSELEKQVTRRKKDQEERRK